LIQVNARVRHWALPVAALEEQTVSWDIINKHLVGEDPLPNLRDYDVVRAAFTW
jgi:hypothetical protein